MSITNENNEYHELNKELCLESRILNEQLSCNYFLELAFNNEVEENFVTAETITEQLTEITDVNYMLHLELHNDNKGVLPILPEGEGVCHIELGLMAGMYFDSNRAKEFISNNSSRINVLTVFFRFYPTYDLELQVDNFEKLVDCLEEVKDKKVIFGMYLQIEDDAKDTSYEMERMRLECVRRFYEEGFEVIRLELEIDYKTLSLVDEWNTLGQIVKGTTEGFLIVKCSEGEANLLPLEPFITNFWDAGSAIYLRGTFCTNFMWKKLATLECEIISTQNCIVHLLPMNDLYQVNIPIDLLETYFGAISDPAQFEEIRFVACDVYGNFDEFTEDEKETIYRVIDKIPLRFTNVSQVGFNDFTLQDFSTKGKELWEKHFKIDDAL